MKYLNKTFIVFTLITCILVSITVNSYASSDYSSDTLYFKFFEDDEESEEHLREKIDYEVNEYFQSSLNELKTPSGGIIGVDERTTLVEPRSELAIILTKFKSGYISQGTAFYIGDNSFLTAAHCLYNVHESNKSLVKLSGL